jgi:hypothetical protein
VTLVTDDGQRATGDGAVDLPAAAEPYWYSDYMKLVRGLTFSPSRFLGIDRVKRGVAKAIGIPTTRQGRRSKLGRLLGMK